jgi:hypothetical protein
MTKKIPNFGSFILLAVMVLINFAKLKKVERQDKIIFRYQLALNTFKKDKKR